MKRRRGRRQRAGKRDQHKGDGATAPPLCVNGAMRVSPNPLQDSDSFSAEHAKALVHRSTHMHPHAGRATDRRSPDHAALIGASTHRAYQRRRREAGRHICMQGGTKIEEEGARARHPPSMRWFVARCRSQSSVSSCCSACSRLKPKLVMCITFATLSGLNPNALKDSTGPFTRGPPKGALPDFRHQHEGCNNSLGSRLRGLAVSPVQMVGWPCSPSATIQLQNDIWRELREGKSMVFGDGQIRPEGPPPELNKCWV